MSFEEFISETIIWFRNLTALFQSTNQFLEDEIVNGTLTALKNDVEQTTEIIRRKQEQMVFRLLFSIYKLL